MAAKRQTPDYVTMAEAAHRIGIKNLRQMRRLRPDFPEPDLVVGAVMLWEWETLRDWYASSVRAWTPEQRAAAVRT